MTQLQAAISSDIDTLESIYQGRGCRRPEGYTYVEFEIGLENFSRFLERYNARATLFMVGRDFKRPQSQASIRDIANQGHEIANHTHTHVQGFRSLSPAQKEEQLARMEDACFEVTGVKPVGFRSPGWNISDDALPILLRRGYRYDSSVFPTAMMPLLKFLHWRSMSQRPSSDRTTMGQSNYMIAPIRPYRTSQDRLARKGDGGLIEFPVTVTPILRLPFFATFLLSTGFDLFLQSYRRLKAMESPIQFQFHLSDFVDYGDAALADQVPVPGKGQYVPKALYTPLPEKLDLFTRAIDVIAQDYRFRTLRQWTTDFS
jgi:predicted deacetylase